MIIEYILLPFCRNIYREYILKKLGGKNMKRFALILVFCVNSLFANPDYHLEFKGSFRVVNPSTEKCNSFFEVKDYKVLLFLVGATYRTLVIHFRNEDGTGYFNGISMVGLLGYNSDFVVSKKIDSYELKASGLFSNEIILMNLEVIIPEEEKCLAEFTGFSRRFSNKF